MTPMRFIFSIMLLAGQVSTPTLAAEAKPSWQTEWEQTVRAAEKEGQVMVSIGGYGEFLYSKEGGETAVADG